MVTIVWLNYLITAVAPVQQTNFTYNVGFPILWVNK